MLCYVEDKELGEGRCRKNGEKISPHQTASIPLFIDIMENGGSIYVFGLCLKNNCKRTMHFMHEAF